MQCPGIERAYGIVQRLENRYWQCMCDVLVYWPYSRDARRYLQAIDRERADVDPRTRARGSDSGDNGGGEPQELRSPQRVRERTKLIDTRARVKRMEASGVRANSEWRVARGCVRDARYT